MKEYVWLFFTSVYNKSVLGCSGQVLANMYVTLSNKINVEMNLQSWLSGLFINLLNFQVNY